MSFGDRLKIIEINSSFVKRVIVDPLSADYDRDCVTNVTQRVWYGGRVCVTGGRVCDGQSIVCRYGVMDGIEYIVCE